VTRISRQPFQLLESGTRLGKPNVIQSRVVIDSPHIWKSWSLAGACKVWIIDTYSVFPQTVQAMALAQLQPYSNPALAQSNPAPGIIS